MRIYEYVPEERDEVLAFRNAIFGHISPARWEAMNCTAVVARDEGRLVGFIPLQFREQCLNARVTVPVIYENAVGVAEDRRGQGIGSQMLDAAGRFIADRADALLVIRGGERSDGYRFYRKTGHGDVSYARWYNLPPESDLFASPPPGLAEGMSVLDRDRWLALEPELLALYDRHYGRFGGGWRRELGYWRTILDSHVYGEHHWWLVSLSAAQSPGRLLGYLVAAQGLWASSNGIYVYEVIGEDEEAVERLIRCACGLGGGTRETSEPLDVPDRRFGAPLVSLANPVSAVLERLGFVAEGTTPHVMARILRPDRIFQRLAAASDLLRDLRLVIVTPHRTLVANDPPQPRHVVHLETKESLFSRLFCCRLDLDAALDMEMVRWDGRDPGLRRDLSQVFAFSEWVQWFTDYV